VAWLVQESDFSEGVDASADKIHLAVDLFMILQEISVAWLVRKFYLGGGVEASMDNIHLTVDFFYDTSGDISGPAGA